MVTDEDSWLALTLDEIADAFADAPFRWWISGGHALDLHIGTSWRTHGDIDVGVLRSDTPAVHAWVKQRCGWVPVVASGGRLSTWDGRPLLASSAENNVWLQRTRGGAWICDVSVGDGDRTRWVYRRDATLHRPWQDAVLRTDSGLPYLAPDLQLLFKAKLPRPKDDADARHVIPFLTGDERAVLAAHLAPGHPWQHLLDGVP